MDAIIVVHVIPPVIPAHLALLRAAGAARRRRPASARASIVIAHNVLPHEARPGDRQLLTAFFSRVDSVVVHSDAQARLAISELGHGVRELDLPPICPVARRSPPCPGTGTRILALGIVRDYKGVDLLLEAAKEVPDVTVTVAGEMWGDAGRTVKELARDPRLRTGSGSTGICPRRPDPPCSPGTTSWPSPTAMPRRPRTSCSPAATACPSSRRRSAPSPKQVRDEVDGLLVPPGDVPALTAALTRLADPSYAARLRSSVRPLDESGPGRTMSGALGPCQCRRTRSVTGQSHHRPTASARTVRNQVAGLPLGCGRRRSWRCVPPTSRLDPTVRRPHSGQRRRRRPAVRCRPQAPQVRRRGGCLGGARCPAAIVRITDGDGRRDAVIVDESGTKSPLSRWVRALGFAPVELG